MCWESSGDLHERNLKLQLLADRVHEEISQMLANLFMQQVEQVVDHARANNTAAKETQPLLKVVRPHLAGTDRHITFVDPRPVAEQA